MRFVNVAVTFFAKQFSLRPDCYMTPYLEHFLPAFSVGCLIASVASLLASRFSGFALPALLIFVGTIAFWAGLAIGSDAGYRGWQSIPDPPREAFSDASAAGAMLFGWIPGTIYCLVVYGIGEGIRRLLHWANPDAKLNP